MAAVMAAASITAGADVPEFVIDLSDDSVPIEASDCRSVTANIAGRDCRRVATDREFSDLLIDVASVTGGPVDFRDARYLTLELYVPSDSWISAIKLNFRDAAGNFGGVPEVANGFVDHPDRWVRTTVDLQTVLPKFQRWHGDASPLPAVTHLSLNPYNADQSSPQPWYVRSVRLSPIPPEPTDDDIEPIVAPEPVVDNARFTMTFDDDHALRRWTSVRAFEATHQAFRRGVAGNATRAIRVSGLDRNKHIVFLPMFDRLTGRPVDLTASTRITFRYHRVPGGDDFDGVGLFVADRDWQNLLYADDFLDRMTPGGWHDVAVDLRDLDLRRVHGDANAKSDDAILRQAHEIRLDLRHDGDHKAIEVWIDDFAWGR